MPLVSKDWGWLRKSSWEKIHKIRQKNAQQSISFSRKMSSLLGDSQKAKLLILTSGLKSPKGAANSGHHFRNVSYVK